MLQSIMAKLRNPQTIKLTLAALAAAWGSATLASYANEKTAQLQDLDTALELRKTQIELAEQQFVNVVGKLRQAEQDASEERPEQPETD